MSKPVVFSDLDHASALEAARGQGKWLLVDATAVWCDPCKAMDRTSWIDPAVVAWIGEHAIAIQVDVDAEPATAKQLEIRAMPTVIAFRDGIEFDRSVGLKQPAELLSWLDGLLRGETALAKLRVEAAQQPTGMLGRMSVARTLANSPNLDEATEAYAWLWEHILEHEPAMFGVRASFMLAEIVDLQPPQLGANQVCSTSRCGDAATRGCVGFRSPHGLDAAQPDIGRAGEDARVVRSRARKANGGAEAQSHVGDHLGAAAH